MKPSYLKISSGGDVLKETITDLLLKVLSEEKEANKEKRDEDAKTQKTDYTSYAAPPIGENIWSGWKFP